MLRAVSWDSFRIVPLVTGDLSRRCAGPQAPCWERRRPRLLSTVHYRRVRIKFRESQSAGEDACGPSPRVSIREQSRLRRRPERCFLTVRC
jgi:hypothetical protein